MARHGLGAKATGAGTTTLPMMALHGVAGGGGVVREIGISNTTNVACDYKVVRLSTAGTPGATITAPAAQLSQNLRSAAPLCVLAHAYTSTGPTLTDLGYRCTLGAAAGSAFVFTFGDAGLEIAASTASGIGLVVENGTGQLLEAYFVWDE